MLFVCNLFLMGPGARFELIFNQQSIAISRRLGRYSGPPLAAIGNGLGSTLLRGAHEVGAWAIGARGWARVVGDTARRGRDRGP